jgi:hypothetical protein
MRTSETNVVSSQQTFILRAGSWLRRIAPALGVFLMAPLTAEYLLGYDTSTGDLGALLLGLIFFAPLYGGPALLIREIARRAGRGWPSMLLLGIGFGVIQAGLIDHSLFNTSYRDIDYWQELLDPTFIPVLGIGASMALNFIAGHAIWSFAVPIAIFETLAPSRRTTPWLGKLGLAIVVVLYLCVSTLIFLDHVESEQFLPSAPQLIGAAAVVVALFGAAFAVGRRPQPPVDLPAPNPWLVGALAFAAFSLPMLIEIVLAVLGAPISFESSWWGVAVSGVLMLGLAVTAARWSRRVGWGDTHRLALAGGALLTHVWIAFLVEPLGDVALSDKLIHNAAFALGAIVLLALAARTANRAPGENSIKP